MAKLQLYNLHPAPGACPWAQRAWVTLLEKKIPFEQHAFDRAAKPQEVVDIYRDIWPDDKATPKAPIIVDVDGTKLTESQVVVEYLEQRYKQQGNQLVPADAASAAKARLFAEVFNASFVSHFIGILFRSKTKTEAAKFVEDFQHGLQVLDKYLQTHGSTEGPFLLGNHFSIAEVLTGTNLNMAQRSVKALRGFDILAATEKAGYTRFTTWAQAVLDRPSLKESSLPEDVLLKELEGMVGKLDAE